MRYRQKIEEVKYKLHFGLITYEQAKIELEPVILEMNIKGKEIAKKYGQKFRQFTFASLIR